MRKQQSFKQLPGDPGLLAESEYESRLIMLNNLVSIEKGSAHSKGLNS
jgi:hypothetical protein